MKIESMASIEHPTVTQRRQGQSWKGTALSPLGGRQKCERETDPLRTQKQDRERRG